MPRSVLVLMAASALAFTAPAADAREVAVTLSGSRASMERQNRIAREEQYSFLRTPVQVRTYVEKGRLVHFEGNADYAVIAGYPYARPVVLAFIERLSSRYREACGERLVVTSLTRPATRQPRNASPLSVHPAGMAVDLRVSQRAECRSWLMTELLDLEDMGLLDATLEKSPPHFHVAVFPAPFSEYEQALLEEAEAEAQRELAALEQARADSAAAAEAARLAQPPAPEEMPRGAGLLVRIASVFARLLMPYSV